MFVGLNVCMSEFELLYAGMNILVEVFMYDRHGTCPLSTDSLGPHEIVRAQGYVCVHACVHE